jgi:cation:H+ antiporter
MPDLLTASLVFIGGLVLLGKGSDFFVEAAARIAKILGVSEFVIGLTLIAVGTSLPELAAGVVASYAGETEIVLGNVVGSNIANIALIMGFSALIAPLLTEREMFYRDGYILLGVSFIFYYFAFDRVITGLEGFILISLFLLYTSFLFKFKPSLSRVYRISEYADFLYDLDKIVDLRSHARFVRKGINLNAHFMLMRIYLRQMKRLLRVGRSIVNLLIQITDDSRRREYKTRINGYLRELRGSVLYEILVLSVSGFSIYLGAEFFIGGAVDIADILGIAPSIVGLTIVSIGTSMPELVVSLQSARKGFGSMVIGNLIGSNIANVTLIIGVCSLISPISLGKTPALQDLNISYIIPFMIFISFIGVLFIRSWWVVRRYEGVIFLSLYLGFLLWLLSSSAVLM